MPLRLGANSSFYPSFYLSAGRPALQRNAFTVSTCVHARTRHQFCRCAMREDSESCESPRTHSTFPSIGSALLKSSTVGIIASVDCHRTIALVNVHLHGRHAADALQTAQTQHRQYCLCYVRVSGSICEFTIDNCPSTNAYNARKTSNSFSDTANMPYLLVVANQNLSRAYQSVYLQYVSDSSQFQQQFLEENYIVRRLLPRA